MIRVTVELVPGGYGEPKVLGRAIIANDGTSRTPKRGSYDARFLGKKTWFRAGRVENFARESRNVWELLYLALGSALKVADKGAKR